MTKISKEDFEAWRDNPVTQEYFRQMQRMIDTARQQWVSDSWASEKLWINGEARDLRIACRAKVECTEQLLKLNLTDEDYEGDDE